MPCRSERRWYLVVFAVIFAVALILRRIWRLEQHSHGSCYQDLSMGGPRDVSWSLMTSCSPDPMMPERLDDYLQVTLLEHANEVANDRIHPLLECHTALAFASAIALHQVGWLYPLTVHFDVAA